jgi:hypothetical protein
MKIILPLSVTIPRKTKADKVFILNLNTYRNTHHFTLNAAKIIYKDNIRLALYEGNRRAPDTKLDCLPPYLFTYTVFPATGRKFDIANVCSIIDKFTCDALIEYYVIPDDSYKIISQVVYKIGKVDKENPRCELEILNDFNKLVF